MLFDGFFIGGSRVVLLSVRVVDVEGFNEGRRVLCLVLLQLGIHLGVVVVGVVVVGVVWIGREEKGGGGGGKRRRGEKTRKREGEKEVG